MRILHTSDWHLGRQFHHVSLLDDQRHVLEQIIGIIRDHDVDVVLIAGDIYDRSVPPASAIALLDETVHRINHELNVPLIIIAGNHDGPERLAFGSRQLTRSAVYISGPLKRPLAPIVLQDAAGEVAFYPLPYADAATVRNIFEVDVHSHDAAMQVLTNDIRADNGTQRRCVVLSHCFIEGSDSSDSERPLSVGGSESVSNQYFRDFNYVALGHLHGPQSQGQPHIRYSGSILKYSFSEVSHKKSVSLIDMDASGQCHIEPIRLKPRHDMRIIEGTLNELLVAGKTDPNYDDYLLVRLLDTHAILDVMGKLREVYPNVLHLERPALSMGGDRKTLDRAQLQKGEMPLFADFYEQMTGETLNDSSKTVVSEIFDHLHRLDNA